MSRRPRPQYRPGLEWILGVAFAYTLTRPVRLAQGLPFVRCCGSPRASSPHGLTAPAPVSHDGDDCVQLPLARGCYHLAPRRTFTSNPVPMPGTHDLAVGLDRLDEPELVLGTGAGEDIDVADAVLQGRVVHRLDLGPATAVLPSPMPSILAIAAAVILWSPVIIVTRMPPPWHSFTASIASLRGGSMRPTRPSRTRFFGRSSGFRPPASRPGSGSHARPSTRSPCAASRSPSRAKRSRSSGAGPLAVCCR